MGRLGDGETVIGFVTPTGNLSFFSIDKDDRLHPPFVCDRLRGLSTPYFTLSQILSGVLSRLLTPILMEEIILLLYFYIYQCGQYNGVLIRSSSILMEFAILINLSYLIEYEDR